MKINEIISEARGKLSRTLHHATPGLVTYGELDNNNSPYLAYRFGVALAGSPAKNEADEQGAIGSRFTMIDFSDADEEIRRGAERKMGVSPTTNTGRGSEEAESVNRVSPVKAQGPITLKKK